MATHSAELERRVLVLAPSGRDALLAGQVLEQAQISAHVCEDAGALIAAMDEGAGAAILANEALTPDVIGSLAAHLGVQPAWSDFPLLIFTMRAASASENRRTLEAFSCLGNVTALERPIHPLTMVSASRTALRARGRQYAARSALSDRERDVRQRDDFLALLGHELRNPLGAMRNAATLAERNGAGLPGLDRPLAVIDRQLRHLTRLVDDLLDVARVTSGKIALKLVPIDLAAATRATRIFDPFTQAARTLDRSQGGIGLGLSVVRALARLHGGDVAATSEGLGRGSEFVVRLPLAPVQQDVSSSPGPDAAPLPITPRHILIVEDGADNRESLQELLEAQGHRVDTAIDGERGVEQALAMRPEVALVDIGLPRVDGYEVARRIRAAMGSKIFLIALTGYGQPDDRARAAAAGFDVHITKPLDFRMLERLIAGSAPGDGSGAPPPR